MDEKNECDTEIRLVTDHEKPPPIDPATTRKRFLMLFLSCLLCIGSYFAYDNPAALEVQLKNVSLI